MAKENLHVCAKCHTIGNGCCYLTAQDNSYMFGLTLSEIDDISIAIGKEYCEFVVKDIVDQEVYNTFTKIHPIFRKTMPNRHRLRLKTVQNRCVFLSTNGCILDYDIRPLYCRLYPFWFTEENQLMMFLSQKCEAQQDAITLYEVLDVLNLKEFELRKLFNKLEGYAADHLSRFTKGSVCK